MRTARLLTGSALAAALLGLGGAPAYANDFGGAGLEVWPSSAAPGTTVTVNTTACGHDGHATGDARAVGDGEFPLTASTRKDVLAGQFTVPHTAKPGTFELTVTCDNGKSARGDLTISGGGEHTGWDRGDRQDPGKHEPGGHDEPRGHVKTGLGGSATTSNRTEIAAGAAVLAVTAVTGGLLLRRRARGPQDRG
ncbi:hypothetical protein [Streptomyces melanogenes]|uniref:Sortase n=1 Tax=Streptomyces melanogenes TaxID=67326 RepID=A0ABZ1XI45_9ACTN|nr:hypothetical protein [Streptomyces melanogenes]